MTVFECRRLSGDLAADEDETLEARYVSAAEFDGLALSPWARAILPRLLAARGTPVFTPATRAPPAGGGTRRL